VHRWRRIVRPTRLLAGVHSRPRRDRRRRHLAETELDVAQDLCAVDRIDDRQVVFDLGGKDALPHYDVVLEPAATVHFRVLDASGQPIAKAAAKHEDWNRAVETDEQGLGTLACVALAGEPIRFGAPRFKDRVLVVHGGEEPVVFLEPTNALAIRVVRADGGPLPALRIHVTNHDRLFIQDDSMQPSYIGGREHMASGIAEKDGTAYFFMRFDADSSGELLLRNVEPDVAFAVEVRALDGRVLAVRECVLGAREWQELVIPIGN